MKIWDISLPIQPGMVIYPGNPEVEFQPSQRLPEDSSNVTQICLGTHTGSHVDAPWHVFEKGIPVDQLPLAELVGRCRVLDLTQVEKAVTWPDLLAKQVKPGERLLLKTSNSFRGWQEFYSDYVYLDGEAAEQLADLPVRLVGVDYLSIKQRGSSDHRPHTALLEKNIPILEALDLSQVPEGEYYLVALPLKLVGLDGSPVRAVLLSQWDQ